MATWPSSAAAQSDPFSDVPDDAYYTEPVIELNRLGVFDGTALSEFMCPGGFCPSEPIDRKTVAVWVVRVLDGQDPPRGLSSQFDDVDCCLPAFWPPFIERMAELGVTRGCGDGSGFCPNRNMTRAEMAVFLSRAFNLPDGPAPEFSDVPDDAWYAADVARLKASGITVGCGDGTQFCPSRITTRAEMATFLWRTLGFSGPEDVILGFALDTVDIQRDLSDIQIPVYYCGPNDTEDAYDLDKLKEQVVLLNLHVSSFYRRQSGYGATDANGNPRGTTITFETGSILSLDLDWSKQSMANFSRAAKSKLVLDPCSEAAVDHAGHHDVLVLVNVPGRGVAGHAVLIGQPPASALTREYQGGDLTKFLGTVAHEIGHAFYDWYHPWDSNLGFKEKDISDPNIKNEYRHELESLMSWVKYDSKRKLTSGGTDSTEVACFQRKQHNWVEQTGSGRGDCEVPASPADPPPKPNLTPRDGALIVSWQAPADDGGADIDDYEIIYRPNGGTWIQWQPGITSASLETTITGLSNGTVYEIRVRARNRAGTSGYSAGNSRAPQSDDAQPPPPKIVFITVGDSAQGALGADGECISVHCRWLHIEITGLGPGPHTLACAHNGIEDAGFSGGVYRSAVVRDWPTTRSCLFGYPGSEVFVIVGAERRGDTWYGGTYSNVITWPSGYEPEELSPGTLINDNPTLVDERGDYSWWQPPADVNSEGYGSNGFRLTLAIGNQDDSQRDNWAIWEFDSVDGEYDIQAWIPSRWATAHAQYLIWVDEDDDGTFSSDEYLDGPWLNQQVVSGWQTLGTYNLRGSVRIEIRDTRTREDWNDGDAANARLAADAIRLVTTGTGGGGTGGGGVMDDIVNNSPTLKDERGTYSWFKPPADIDSLGYGTNGFYLTLAIGNQDDSQMDNWAIWEFDAVSGEYDIQAFIPAKWATAHAQYLIWVDEDDDGTFSSDEYLDGPWLNQQVVSGWQTLGTYNLRGSVRIEIRDTRTREDWNDGDAANARLAADAIRLRKVT